MPALELVALVVASFVAGPAGWFAGVALVRAIDHVEELLSRRWP